MVVPTIRQPLEKSEVVLTHSVFLIRLHHCLDGTPIEVKVRLHLFGAFRPAHAGCMWGVEVSACVVGLELFASRKSIHECCEPRCSALAFEPQSGVSILPQ